MNLNRKGFLSCWTQAPKGTQDMLPKDAHRWQSVEANMRRICALAGYREIRTPMFEHTELFQRGVGDATDVVQKEMYTFCDKGNRSITLKPEGTAGVVRALIESHMYADALPAKLYYVSCPCFRYEKPQSGRLRQFHQNGVEVFGAKDPSVDAEIIDIARQLLDAFGIAGARLKINSIGCPTCRKAYLTSCAPTSSRSSTGCARPVRSASAAIRCAYSTARRMRKSSPTRPRCSTTSARNAPRTLRSCAPIWTPWGIAYVIDPRIVRGLDYYTRTVFEYVIDAPGGELTVCGGGRYDGLVEELGGPATPGHRLRHGRRARPHGAGPVRRGAQSAGDVRRVRGHDGRRGAHGRACAWCANCARRA